MSIVENAIEPLCAGQRLTVEEFMRRWEAMPEVKFAELIDGVVYMPSPQTSDHGCTQFEVDTWLGTYRAHTPGCNGGSQSTWLMLRSAPQPDVTNRSGRQRNGPTPSGAAKPSLRNNYSPPSPRSRSGSTSSTLSIPEWIATGAPDPPGCPRGFAAGPVWLSQSTDGQ